MLDAFTRWEDAPPVKLGMRRGDAFIVMMGLQTVLSHPGLPDIFAKRMVAVGRQIQETICDTPELYAMSEAGWNRDFDVEPEASGD
ncbi:hypothetical protein DKG71_42180 (plasmid) [Streptomyces sp. NEAU-S7GS2]|nr:hypothetical protein DKG71_42180 [Streptomyces sp. NEAU-S7GS2]